jgi:hypothetical protein
MEMSFRLSLLALLLMLHSVIYGAVPDIPAKTQIILLESKSNKLVNTFSNHLRTAIHLNNPNIDVQRIAIEQPEIMLNTPLVIALGKEALEYLLNSDYQGHILTALIDVKEFELLIEQYQTQKRAQNQKQSQRHIGAVFHEASLIRQLLLFKEIKPTAKSVGLLISSDEKQYLNELRSIASKLNLRIESEVVNNTSDLSHDLVQLIHRSDAIIATSNSSIYNRSTIKSILLSLYRYNKFLIGSNKHFIRAGSVATTYTSTQQLLDELVNEVSYFFETQKLHPPHFSQDFLVAFNKDVAHSLNLSIKEEQYYIDAIKAGEINLGKKGVYE